MKQAKFIKAQSKNSKSIYSLWSKATNSRLLGLIESIKKNQVYLFSYNKQIVGFVRFSLFEKTLDYLSIKEIVLISDDVLAQSRFSSKLDELILGLGYVKAKIVTNLDCCSFLTNYNWEIVGNKYSVSSGKTYNNFILMKELVTIKASNFGKHLIS